MELFGKKGLTVMKCCAVLVDCTGSDDRQSKLDWRVTTSSTTAATNSTAITCPALAAATSIDGHSHDEELLMYELHSVLL